MTSLLSNSRRPDVSLYKKGTIDISARIAKQLSLADGDVIDVLEHRGEYLLYVRHKRDNIIGRYEGVVHPINNKKSFTNRFRVYSRKLTDAIFQAAAASLHSSSILGGASETDILRLPAGLPINVAGIGVTIPLITRNPL